MPRISRPIPPSKIKPPAKKLEMVANRVVGVAPKMGKPKSSEADPSMIRPGHHKY
jgi:hypothetical protein